MKRFVDDPTLASELRAELERSRRAGRDYDALAKLPQLRAALSATPVSRSSESPSGLASHAGSLGSVVGKLALLAAAVATGVFVAMLVQPRPEPAKPSVVSAPTPTPVATPRAPEPQPIAPAPAVEAQPPQDPKPAERSSRREIAQLVRIRALLQSDPAEAYRMAMRSEAEFPRGVLSEERQAVQILALVKSGVRDAANQKAKEFFARYPQSPLREQLEAALRH